MGLAITLDLRRLGKWFEPGTQRRDFLGKRPAIECLDFEHATVAQIPIVRNGEHFCAGFFF